MSSVSAALAGDDPLAVQSYFRWKTHIPFMYDWFACSRYGALVPVALAHHPLTHDMAAMCVTVSRAQPHVAIAVPELGPGVAQGCVA